MTSPANYDLAPLLPILAVGGSLAAAAIIWLWLRQRDRRPAARLRALTVLTLFLTFDLVLFGAFTRLTDSGLGCPDWPGCYGTATPVGAQVHIEAAQTALPSGPVTHRKAWIEMVHRYLATGVGALITWLAVLSWRASRRAGRDPDGSRVIPPDGSPVIPPDEAPVTRPAGSPVIRISPWWATATLAWVCLQGAFGALTVTMKLYPAIVTAHLLGGIGLLVLLAVQSERCLPTPVPMRRGLFVGTVAVGLLVVLQIALGGWVSTNYAVLACRDFPTCQGSFWPPMDVARGFTLRRGLGVDASGEYLPFAALTAIHVVHRLGAAVVLVATLLLAWRLHATGEPALRRWAKAIGAVAAWQVLSGLGNVAFDWPLVAALAHTGGAALWVTMLAVLATRAQVLERESAAHEKAPGLVREPTRDPRLRSAP